MNKKALFLASLFLMLGAAFSSNQPYTATISPTMDTYTTGENLVVYGYITHNAGEPAYDLSKIKVRIYDPALGPSHAVSIRGDSKDFHFYSDYSNTGDLVIDGAYYASVSTNSLSLSDGKQYTVDIAYENTILAVSQFAFSESLARNSALSSVSYFGMSDVKVAETISNNDPNPCAYDISVYVVGLNGESEVASQSGFNVDAGKSNSVVMSFSQAALRDGPNIIVSKVNNANPQTVMPLATLLVMNYGDEKSISFDGSISMGDCKAKENQESACEFVVENTGLYPASYSVSVDSSMDASVQMPDAVLQPGESAKGILTIRAKEGDSPSSSISLNLMSGGQLVDSLTKTITVEPRDLLHNVSIVGLAISPSVSKPGDDIVAQFALKNSGDYVERVTLQYKLGDENYVTYGGMYVLSPGEERQITLRMAAPNEDGTIFVVRVMKSNQEMAKVIQYINVEPFVYTPYVRWSKEYLYVVQGNGTENAIVVRNDGNTADYFKVSVDSPFAYLDKRVYLNPSSSKTFELPILVRDDAKPGVYKIKATICSLTGGDCQSDDFTLTILEKDRSNTTVYASSPAKVSGKESPVFRIDVFNNEGATETYTIALGSFDGEYKLDPEEITLMNGENGTFYVLAQPKSRVSQNITYSVLMNNKAVAAGNLTIEYANDMLSGLMTLSKSGSIGAIILGVALITALVFVGLKSFNQSKVELKYWK